jgi:protein SCO1/2
MSLKNNSIIIVAAIAAMSAGFWLASIQSDRNELDAQEKALADARKNYSAIQGSILSPARKIAVPALIKDDGKTFTIDDISGHWSLLFFGYTHCPDICPMTLGVAAQAKKLALASSQDFPQVIFISVDPERDKVETLGEYVQYFDSDFIGVTGDEALIKALTLQMSVVYMKMTDTRIDSNGTDGSASDNYLVDHSSALLLINPEGRLVAFLNPPHDAQTIVNDIQTVKDLSR